VDSVFPVGGRDFDGGALFVRDLRFHHVLCVHILRAVPVLLVVRRMESVEHGLLSKEECSAD
jgi:hypothetical protein